MARPLLAYKAPARARMAAGVPKVLGGEAAAVQQAMQMVARYVDGRGGRGARDAFLFDLGMAQLTGLTGRPGAARGGLDLVAIVASIETLSGMVAGDTGLRMRGAVRLAEIAEGLQARAADGYRSLDAAALRRICRRSERGGAFEHRGNGGPVMDLVLGSAAFGNAGIAGAGRWLMQQRARMPGWWQVPCEVPPGQGDWPGEESEGGGAAVEQHWRTCGETRVPRLMADLVVAFGLAERSGRTAAEALGEGLMALAPAHSMRVMATALDILARLCGIHPGDRRLVLARRLGGLPPEALARCVEGLAQMYTYGCDVRLLRAGALMLANDSQSTWTGAETATSLLGLVMRAGEGWDAAAWSRHGPGIVRDGQAIADSIAVSRVGAEIQMQGVAEAAGRLAALGRAQLARAALEATAGSGRRRRRG